MATGTSADFTGVWGTSATDIYVVGQWPDRILHSEGATWSTVPGVTIHRPAAIWGSSATDIYVMGFAGAMLFYDGASWSEMETGTGNDLNAVWGTSAADVYVVGSPSLILRGVRGASVSVTPSDDTLTAAGETVQLAAEARDANNSTISGVTFAWKSSDLSVATVDATGLVTAVANGTTAIAATTPGGAADTALITVTLSQLPPVAVIDSPGHDTTLTLGESINFQGTASDVDGTVVAHSWDFGDGNGSAAEDPGTYTYAGVGTFTVTYQVVDDDGASSPAASVAVTVVAALDPIEPGVWHGTTGAGFNFDFTVAAGGDQITQIQYFWSGLSCDGVTMVSGSTTVSRAPGWSISGRQFTVDPDDEPTITGTFDDSGTAASGSWQWLSCSGTWTGSP
jgi:PKD repeat protein